MRQAARSDGNQLSIIEALKRIGCSVYYMKQPLDLLVGYRGVTYILECKMPGKSLNGNQSEFIARWNGQYAVVHNTQEALTAILGDKAMR